MSLYDQFLTDTENIEPFSAEWFKRLALLSRDIIEDGLELDELKDVLVATPANGNILYYDGSTSLWKDKTLATLKTDLGLSGTNTGDQTITLSGDVTGGPSAGAITTTLSNSGVVAGTYNDSATSVRPFTVDAKGRLTSIGSAVTITPAWSSITSKPTTLSGFGITDALSNSTSSTQSGYFGDIYLYDDSTPSHYLQITNSANLTALRTLSINVNDASRTLSMSGNLTVSSTATVSGTNTGDQTITLSGAVTGSGTGAITTVMNSNLDSLTDVVITSPSNGQVLKYNGTNWINDTDATGGAGSLSIGSSITSGTVGSVLFVGTGPALQQDNANLFWDDTNDRLGVKNAAPTYTLDVTGQTRLNGEVVIGNSTITTSAPFNSLRVVTASTTSTHYGISSEITHTHTGTAPVRAINGSTTVTSSGGANVTQSQAIAGTMTISSGTTFGNGGFFGGLFSANVNTGALNNGGLVTGIRSSASANATTSTLHGVRSDVSANASGTTVTTGINYRAYAQLTNSAVISTYQGLSFDNWVVSGGGSITTNYLIYADTTTNVGTTKYTLYMLPDMPAYHVGKFGIGTGVTAPTARLQVRDATEQLRLEFDGNNYCSVSVANNGATTFNSVNGGVDANGSFSFSDSVSVPDDAYAAGWNGSTAVPTKNAVYDRLEQMKTECFIVAASDETTAITAGTNKVKFRMPYAFTVTAVRASLSTAQASGNIFTVDINESGTSILSTKLTIDNTETTSTTAATPAVISDTALADDAEISIDVDQIGNSTAKGLKVTIIGFRP